MGKILIGVGALLCIAIAGVGAQGISFGLGDAALEASLNDMNASAKVDLAGFSAEVTLSWGQPAASVQLAFGEGLVAGEVYLASALAKISGKPLAEVVASYKKNKAKGWGALAKDLGIKPGSKEFKALKDGAANSSGKLKKKK